MKRINRDDPFWIQTFCAAITGLASRDNIGTQLGAGTLVNRALDVADFAVERIAMVNEQDENRAAIRVSPPEQVDA